MKTNKWPIVISIILVILVTFLITGTDFTTNSKISIDGVEMQGPIANLFGGIIGVVISVITLFCVAILLLFVFSGVGVILLLAFIIIGAILLSVALPFLLPVIIPLAFIFIFIYLQRRKKKEIL